MLGYYKNEKATENYFYTDESGNVWACTGDMGYVTEDGNLYVDGRISDSYINKDGETIYLFDIERAILNIEQIRQCKAVVSEINQEKHHVAHISLDSGANIDDVLCKIKAHCEKILPQNHIPNLIKIHNDSLPVSPSGKLNIEEMRNNTVDIVKI
jgi:long-chain acyl-CoA synthetase